MVHAADAQILKNGRQTASETLISVAKRAALLEDPSPCWLPSAVVLITCPWVQTEVARLGQIGFSGQIPQRSGLGPEWNMENSRSLKVECIFSARCTEPSVQRCPHIKRLQSFVYDRISAELTTIWKWAGTPPRRAADHIQQDDSHHILCILASF